MLVSICCITYNHHRFIRKALDSFLSQSHNDIEVIVSDDASSDKTPEVIKEYAGRYPSKIKPILHSQRQGMLQNFQKALKKCTGDFVALCEGDDYWIDDQKLKRQVSFLNGNPNYSFCFHQVFEEYKGKLAKSSLVSSDYERDYTINDLAQGNFISTPSVVYRNGLFDSDTPIFLNVRQCDYVVHLLNAARGPIKFFPEPMAVYRIHNSGVWSLKGPEHKYLSTIKTIEALLGSFDQSIELSLINQKAMCLSKLAENSFLEGNVKKAEYYLVEAFSLAPALEKVWLATTYPKILNQLFSSKKFKVAQKLAILAKRIGF